MCVTVRDLKSYLSSRVPNLVNQLPARDSGDEVQTPVYFGFSGGAQNRLVLARDRNSQKPSVVLRHASMAASAGRPLSH